MSCFHLQSENAFIQQSSLVSSWQRAQVEGTNIHNEPQPILAKLISTNMKGWRALWPWMEEVFCRIIIAVLCPLVVICVIGWQWPELASSLPSHLSCFEESPFQILSWLVPASWVVGRCGNLVKNSSPQSPLHSHLWLAGDHQITWT